MMSIEHENKRNKIIESFKDILTNQLESIEKLSSKNNEILFKKMLYISFLESLAKASYPKIKHTKKRFTTFLFNFTSWKECNNYSIIHIANKSFTTNTLTFYKEEINKLLEISLYRSSVFIDDIALLPNKYIDIEIKKNKVLLDSCTYGSLLYKARNSLVHQFQISIERDGEIGWGTDKELPYFQVTGNVEFNDKRKELEEVSRFIEIVFPNIFLKKLALEGLVNFIQYCKENKFNPFEEYYSERKIHEEKL